MCEVTLATARGAACPLLAQSGHGLLHCTCPLSGVKRTSLFATHMSAFDPKRTWRGYRNLRKIAHRSEPPGGDMQRRGGSEQPVKRQRAKRPKAPGAKISADRAPEQFDRLKNERDEAREQLAATA